MKTKTTIVVATLVCGLLVVGGGVWAMSSGNYAIDWDVIGGGGGPASSTNYAMRGTIGQPVADTSFSANYGLWSGYRYPAAGEPSITITSPNGGENWNIGSTQTITWASSGVTGGVHIAISSDGGSSWSVLTANTPNDGSYSWIVTGPATAQARIRVTSASDGSIWDMSDANFIICAEGVAVSVEPANYTTAVDETFTVDIELSGADPVLAASVYMDFDNTYLEVQGITPGSALDMVLQNHYDNVAGTIDYAAGKLIGTLPAATFTLVTIEFKALAETSGTPLTFVFEGLGRLTDVITTGSVSILGTVTDGQITITSAAEGVAVGVEPASKDVGIGNPFTVDIFVDPDTDIAGVQFSLSFDPSLLTANGVTQGNLLKQGGASTFFMPGTIDNVAGTITGVAGSITSPGQSVSSPGTFATISFTATEEGTSALNLSNVIVANTQGEAVPITLSDGSVTIYLWDDWDVNMDGWVNVLDMVLVGQDWAATGAAHWIRQDVNRDGAINVLDMVLIGQHWTG